MIGYYGLSWDFDFHFSDIIGFQLDHWMYVAIKIFRSYIASFRCDSQVMITTVTMEFPGNR